MNKNNQYSHIIDTIKDEQIKTIKEFNRYSISDSNISKRKMIECFEVLVNIILHSSYTNRIARDVSKNVSYYLLDQKVKKDFVQKRLLKELELAKSCTPESLALKISYWANRIAHRLEDEVMYSDSKESINRIFIKYYLNPRYNYDLISARKSLKNEDSEISKKLECILHKEIDKLGFINTPQKLNNLFLGLSIRNELWTLKLQMLQYILLTISKEQHPSVKVTYLRGHDCYINKTPALRLVIREVNGIAPVIMHCDKEKINEYLQKNNLKRLEPENSNKVINFAKSKVVGMHFVLNNDETYKLKKQAKQDPKIKTLSDIIYKGEKNER